MGMRIIKPTSEEIIEALRVCMQDTPGKANPCDECYLNRLSRDGLVSTGRPCFECLAFDAIKLIQGGIIEIANLRGDLELAVQDINNMATGKYKVCNFCGRIECQEEKCHFQWRGAEE